MLRWALTFFIFSVIAGILGFSGIAVQTSGIAQILFYFFIGLFILSLVTGRRLNK